MEILGIIIGLAVLALFVKVIMFNKKDAPVKPEVDPSVPVPAPVSMPREESANPSILDSIRPEDLQKFTKAQLREIGMQNGINLVSSLTKQQMIDALLK